MRLSKTKFLSGLQCEKQLYLRVHHPEWAVSVVSPAAVTGQVVEEPARQQFSGAVLVERNKANIDPYSKTQQLIRDSSVDVILEAAIRTDDFALFVDAFVRQGNGWDLIEIKAGTSVADRYIDDVAIQALALDKASIPIKRCWLMHINSEFVYRGGQDYNGLFVREDISEQVHNHIPFIKNSLARFKQVINQPQPERHIGSYCKKPYPCPYIQYCEGQDAKYPVAFLPNGWRVAQRMLQQGIYDIRNIPIDELSSEIHRWIWRVTIEGKPELQPGAAQILNALDYPRFYLDFECIQFAIPIWENTQPYMQLPFQWSCHIQSDVHTLHHEEFLDISGSDPRRRFAEALLATCGEAGPIVVYNQSFEKRIIKELAAEYPDLSDNLLALNTRVFDLLPVVKQHYYHPGMKGSWSIKNVLPCLVPELSYSQLGKVQDGTQAQAAYLRLIDPKLSEAERRVFHHDLLEYCKLDTYAMVKIVDNICGYTT